MALDEFHRAGLFWGLSGSSVAVERCSAKQNGGVAAVAVTATATAMLNVRRGLCCRNGSNRGARVDSGERKDPRRDITCALGEGVCTV